MKRDLGAITLSHVGVIAEDDRQRFTSVRQQTCVKAFVFADTCCSAELRACLLSASIFRPYVALRGLRSPQETPTECHAVIGWVWWNLRHHDHLI